MFSRFSGFLKLKKEKMTILVIGLNNSGKSSIIHHLKNPTDRQHISVPTVGFNVEQFENYGVTFNMIDMSGAVRYRNLWEHNFSACHGIIFVIDSSDAMRLVIVKDELEVLLKHRDLQCRLIPILFYGNKKDCEESLSSIKIATALELENIEDKPWLIVSSNGRTGEGLEEGVKWLIQNIRSIAAGIKKKSKNKSVKF